MEEKNWFHVTWRQFRPLLLACFDASIHNNEAARPRHACQSPPKAAKRAKRAKVLDIDCESHVNNNLVSFNIMATEQEKTIFGHCTFAFVLNKDLPPDQAGLVCLFLPLPAQVTDICIA